MIRLSRYFIIPFEDPAISLDSLIAFATDHLQRMIANNPEAVLEGVITPTAVALAVLGECSSSDSVRLGTRKAAKGAKNAFREDLPGQVRRIAQRVAGEYGDPSAQMTACFPHGREEFKACRDDRLEDHLQGLVAALTPLGGLMAVALGEAERLLSTWTSLHAASGTSSGAKTTTESGKREARVRLERQLTLNVLGLAAQFLDQEDKADLYFQQYLLGLPGAQEKEEPEPVSPPSPPVP
ncbi:MAG: hypothetical protein V4726_04465 [Verrucomicrobiota bacterium]